MQVTLLFCLALAGQAVASPALFNSLGRGAPFAQQEAGPRAGGLTSPSIGAGNVAPAGAGQSSQAVESLFGRGAQTPPFGALLRGAADQQQGETQPAAPIDLPNNQQFHPSLRSDLPSNNQPEEPPAFVRTNFPLNNEQVQPQTFDRTDFSFNSQQGQPQLVQRSDLPLNSQPEPQLQVPSGTLFPVNIQAEPLIPPSPAPHNYAEIRPQHTGSRVYVDEPLQDEGLPPVKVILLRKTEDDDDEDEEDSRDARESDERRYRKANKQNTRSRFARAAEETVRGFQQSRYTNLDLAAVDFNNFKQRSSGHKEYITVKDNDLSGEIDIYKLVGVAPSQAVRGGAATTYSSRIGPDVPIYSELDDASSYWLRSLAAAARSRGGAATPYSAGGRPYKVRAETAVSGDTFAVLLDD